MDFLDRAKDITHQVKEQAGPLIEKASGMVAKGVDAAAKRLDKATGGKYHDTIEHVTDRVEGVLHPTKKTSNH